MMGVCVSLGWYNLSFLGWVPRSGWWWSGAFLDTSSFLRCPGVGPPVPSHPCQLLCALGRRVVLQFDVSNSPCPQPAHSCRGEVVVVGSPLLKYSSTQETSLGDNLLPSTSMTKGLPVVLLCLEGVMKWTEDTGLGKSLFRGRVSPSRRPLSSQPPAGRSQIPVSGRGIWVPWGLSLVGSGQERTGCGERGGGDFLRMLKRLPLQLPAWFPGIRTGRRGRRR